MLGEDLDGAVESFELDEGLDDANEPCDEDEDADGGCVHAPCDECVDCVDDPFELDEGIDELEVDIKVAIFSFSACLFRF